jgi:D-sedoheptulose 7-phosphate isomerase
LKELFVSLEKYSTTLSYQDFLKDVFKALEQSEITTSKNKSVDMNTGITSLCEHILDIKSKNKTMYFVGNGASAAMASHMSADFFKTAGIRSLPLNDTSLMTAVGNDISYDDVYSYPLKRLSNVGDTLVTISSSGNSPNIIKAINVARENGLSVITFSGMSPDNKSRTLGDTNIFVPGKTYGYVETSHQILLHYWLDFYMGQFHK